MNERMTSGAHAPDVAARNVRDGLWLDKTIYQLLAERTARTPDKTLIVDRFGRMSYGEALAATDRIAANLHALGIGRGDVVAVQLPNWRQFPLMAYALDRLGAICTPLPSIYRHRELRLMLGLVRPKAAVIPHLFRGFDHLQMMRELADDLPDCRHVFVAEGNPGWARRFEDLLVPAPPAPPHRPDANAISEIVFTSGTTGEPKGVMHTANTNLCPLLGVIEDQGLDHRDVVLMASTFGHQTGFVYGGHLPVLIGGSVVLMERWDPTLALELIEREGVTWTMGATPFLQDLLAAPDARRATRSLRAFLCSGAPIPRVYLDRARDTLGCKVMSGWGMTEVGLVTLSRMDDPADVVAGSDGRPLRGSAVRIVDDSGTAVAPGTDGDLLCRGASLFAGYYQRPEITRASYSEGGWFHTGDRARDVGGGYIRITGRSKDIIIRGGENIPVVEVEELLHKHPAVATAAVVAVPDPRLQERACAAVLIKPGMQFDLAEMRRHLAAHQLAQQYFPEHVVAFDSFPMTPSGKVQKFLLRTQVIAALEADGALKGADRHGR